MVQPAISQLPENLTVEQLESLVSELMIECDERHAHEDALAEQVRELGGIPAPSSPILAVCKEPIFND